MSNKSYRNKFFMVKNVIGICLNVRHKLTSAHIFPTIEMVSTGYCPRRVSAPRRIASLPDQKERGKQN